MEKKIKIKTVDDSADDIGNDDDSLIMDAGMASTHKKNKSHA